MKITVPVSSVTTSQNRAESAAAGAVACRAGPDVAALVLPPPVEFDEALPASGGLAGLAAVLCADQR